MDPRTAPPDFDLTGLGAPERQPWPPAAQAAVGCGSGCALLVLLQAVLIWFAFPASIELLQGIKASVHAPPKVTVGQKFPLTVTFRNETPAPLTVTDISVEGDVLRRFTLENAQPKPVTGPLTIEGKTVWTYRQTVQPGASWSVRFDATAKQPGRLNGQVSALVSDMPRPLPFSVEASGPAQNETPMNGSVR